MTERLRIRRDELFAKDVDQALERDRRLRDPVGPPAPVSPARRVFMSSLFYLPLAGLIGSVLAWALLEPGFRDFEQVGGRVVLVNTEPFEWAYGCGETSDAISLTVGDKEVVAFPGETRLEPGADGQPAFRDLTDIEAGTVVEACGEAIDRTSLVALALRPATEEHAAATGQFIQEGDGAVAYLFFPVTAALIGLGLLLAEGISSRNWLRMMERAVLGTLLTVVFAFLGMVPAGLMFILGEQLFTGDGFVTVDDLSTMRFMVFAACRSVAWACMGAALGVGMNIARSTKMQLRNSVLGGALGGALGGVFFDPIDRFFGSNSIFTGADASRLVGLIAVGVSVGVFIALVDRLAREAWVLVRTGPLAGKSFVLYKTPTLVGSAPRSDIYLFKDADIDASHACIHRVGNAFEIEDTSRRTGVKIGGQAVRRRRLVSGDQIVIGATVLQFEERTKGRDHV